MKERSYAQPGNDRLQQYAANKAEYFLDIGEDQTTGNESSTMMAPDSVRPLTKDPFRNKFPKSQPDA